MFKHYLHAVIDMFSVLYWVIKSPFYAYKSPFNTWAEKAAHSSYRPATCTDVVVKAKVCFVKSH